MDNIRGADNRLFMKT